MSSSLWCVCYLSSFILLSYTSFKSRKPKPGFALAEGQEEKPHIVLDSEDGTRVPGAINTYLRDYQRDGVQFLYDRYKKGKGALNGDLMGLGKTVQAIAFLSAIMDKSGLPPDRGRRRRYVSRLQDSEEYKKTRKLPPANSKWPTCLIIAPKSVVLNWEREFETVSFQRCLFVSFWRPDARDVVGILCRWHVRWVHRGPSRSPQRLQYGSVGRR